MHDMVKFTVIIEVPEGEEWRLEDHNICWELANTERDGGTSSYDGVNFTWTRQGPVDE